MRRPQPVVTTLYKQRVALSIEARSRLSEVVLRGIAPLLSTAAVTSAVSIL